MIRSVLKYGGLLLLVIAVVFGLLFAYAQGLLPFMQPAVNINVNLIRDRIEQLSQLTTTRYTYSMVITTEADMPEWLRLLYGQRQVMVATGYVVAGIDLSQIEADAVKLNGGILTLELPASALQDCFFDERGTYIAEQSTGIFARRASNIDQETRRYAIQQFREAALNSGILEAARAQAAESLTSFIQLLGVNSIEQINLSFAPANPQAPLPSTCS